MIKKIVTFTTICAAFVLSGCATSNVPMSDTEKSQIKSGQLVKFDQIVDASSEKLSINRNAKIYVCVQPYQKLADGTQPCYQKLSVYFEKYFEDAGFKIASSEEHADEVIIAHFGVAYVGAHESPAYHDLCYQAIEDSLEKGDQPELSQEAMDAMYSKDVTLHQEIANQARLETAGKVLVGIIGVAMGGVNGALNTSQALTGITNPANIEAPYGTKGPKAMRVFLEVKGKTIANYQAIYNGPRDLYQSFGTLFPLAVKSTAELFAQNASTK